MTVQQTLLNGASLAVLLVHFDGTNGSTTFVDSSVYAQSLGASGVAQLSTAQFKFGTASLNVSSVGYATVAANANLNFGATDFTVDFWFRGNGVSDHDGLVSGGNAAGTAGGFYIEVDQSGSGLKFRVNVNYTDGTNNSGYGTTTVSAGTWYHVALVRSGNNFNLYVNGTSEVSWTSSKTLRDNTNGLVMGRLYTDSNNFYMDGWIDELRITRQAEWIANFTPPAAAYVQ